MNARFRELYNRMTKDLKCRPGGRRRNQLFDQVSAGNYAPWTAILEAIDLVIDESGQKEENVLPFAQAFVDYVQGKYAAKECAALAATASVQETLTSAITADTDEVNAEAQAIAEPNSIAALEQVIATTVRDSRSNKRVLTLCGRRLSVLRGIAAR